MAIDYNKFDKTIDIEGLKDDLQEVEKNGGNTGDYPDIPDGSYEVKITKLELVASKKGDPMVSCWFEILTGDYKGRLLFMNQVVTQGFQIHKVNTFLKSLDSGVEIKFDTYSQYGQMLLDIHEEIDGKLEYLIKLSTDKKGFNNYTVEEVYDA